MHFGKVYMLGFMLSFKSMLCVNILRLCMKNNNKILNIEALRGAAIILVLMAHSFFVPAISKIQHFFDFGRGVDVFLLYQGF